MPPTEIATVVPKIATPRKNKTKVKLCFKLGALKVPAGQVFPALLTLRETKSPVNAQLHVCVDLCPVHDGIICPHAKPVVVSQGGGLLEGIQEDDGEDEPQADGLEILHV